MIENGRRSSLSSPLAVLALLAPALAHGQSDREVAEEPTNGLRMPSLGIAGEVDATSTVLNPAGLHFLEGPHFGLVVDGADRDDVTAAGQGVGLYAAGSVGGSLVPRLGFGLGYEFLEPSRTVLAPDPGQPRRLSLSTSTALGESASLGLAYQRYWDAKPSGLDGLDSWTAGLMMRLGARFSAGAVVRDLGAPTVASTPVQRRYELELVTRPLATDRLELGLGGRIGEVRADLDGWLRGSLRLVRGVYLRAELSSVELNRIARTPTQETSSSSEREYRLAAGLEVSFGGLGAMGMAHGAYGADDETAFRGGTLMVRVSPTTVPSVFGEDTRIERIDLDGSIGDRALTSIVARMRNLERDEDVVAVVIQMGDLAAGWATMEELRARIHALRAAGKKVFVYMVEGSTTQYFVASAADQIYLDPAGGIRLTGFAAVSMFLGGAFELLGVKAQFVKIGEYKSAPEEYTRTSPSEPAWRQRNELYDSVYDQFISLVARDRKIDPAELRKIVDGGPYTAGDLEKRRDLVDRIAAPEEVEKAIAEYLGRRYPLAAAVPTRPERWAYPEIAVIYLAGDIVGGESRSIPILGRTLAGGETLARAIASARGNPSIRAIVLRIDSPGGSALASEIISREVFKTRGVKPIICSMGDTAASGGYFAAAGCDTIFAEPTTLTGSIGIFTGTFDIRGLLSKVGISTTTYERGEHADIESLYHTWTDDERELLQNKIAHFYKRFLETVARGRKMTVEEVDAVGRGRVWSGTQAKEVGLVDELGGVLDAIQLAKVRAGMHPDTKVQLIPLPTSQASFLDKLVGGLVPSLHATEPQIFLPFPGGDELIRSLPASLWAEPGAVQARLPYDVIWK